METTKDNKKLLDYLQTEYGIDETSPEYTEEDTKQVKFITEEGQYHAFITTVGSQQITRTKPSKTKAVGTKFNFLNIGLKVIEKIGTKDVFGGSINDSILYEPGMMLNYQNFCLAARCLALNDGNTRKYFPKAPHDKGGAVGMPVTIDVKMELQQKVAKDDTGKYVKIFDSDGKPVMVKRAKVFSYLPWDTSDRYDPLTEDQPPFDNPANGPVKDGKGFSDNF